MLERRCCNNCAIISTWDRCEEFVCRTCGHNEAMTSDMFEDDFAINQANKDLLNDAQDFVARLEAEIKKFEDGWYSSWNSDKDEQMNWETPEKIEVSKYL